MYCTISLPEESRVNEEDFDIKSRLTQSKQLEKKNSSMVQYKEGLYVFETFFLSLSNTK